MVHAVALQTDPIVAAAFRIVLMTLELDEHAVTARRRTSADVRREPREGTIPRVPVRAREMKAAGFIRCDHSVMNIPFSSEVTRIGRSAIGCETAPTSNSAPTADV